MLFDSSSSILITGGTGSFGKAFIGHVLSHYPDVRRIVIYSRDEMKQWELQQLFPEHKYPQLRFFLGDIRDRDRLRRALEQIDRSACCCSEASTCRRIQIELSRNVLVQKI